MPEDSPAARLARDPGARVARDPDARSPSEPNARSSRDDAPRDLRDVEVRARHLVLRSFTPADAAEIFVHTTPAVARYMGWEVLSSPDVFEPVWCTWLVRMEAGTDLFLVVRDRGTKEFLSMVGLHFKGNADPAVGIWIKESEWGRGHGGEAVAALIAWAFVELGLDGVLYPVVTVNAASRCIAERLGGALVGTRTQRKPGGIDNPMVVYRIPRPA